MNTKEFCEWAKDNNEIQITSWTDEKIYLLPTSETSFLKLINVADRSKNFISLHPQDDSVIYCLHNNNLEEFILHWEKETTSNVKGIADLTWATCQQIGDELKSRENLIFALMWMEGNELEKLSVEAGGNPTLVAGMVTRGLNLILNWAAKPIEEEDEHS